MSEPTPGPWRWELNLKSRSVQLCGGNPKSGFGAFDLTVMDFERWGMGGAKCRFRTGPETMNVMKPVENFAAIVIGREHHAEWFQCVAHPDANLIAAAPDMLAALKRQQANIRRWLETGIPADAAESQAISEQIDAAVRKAEGK